MSDDACRVLMDPNLTERADVVAELPVDEASRNLLLALGDGPCLVGLYDSADAIRYANRVFWDTFLPRWPGLPPTFANMVHYWRSARCGVIVQGEVGEWLRRAYQRRRLDVPRRSFEVDLADGRWMWLMESRLPSGWILCIGADITKLKQSEHAMRSAREQALRDSRTDSLTGLSNRRHILELAAAAIEEHRASGADLAVAVIDLDHFKQINDRFGHAAGDRVLRHFSALFRRRLRRGDRLGRVGGEEFLLLLPGTQLEVARSVLERLRQSMVPVRLPDQDDPLTYSFSTGLTTPLPGERIESVLSRADAALYAAKRAGRNRVECAMA